MSDPRPLVQEVYAAFGAGDLPNIIARLDPACVFEFVGPRSIPYCGRFVGHEAIQRFFALVAENDDIQVFEPREMLAGTDHVTVFGWERTRAKTSGRTFETEWVHVFKVAGGKVVAFKGFYDSAAVVAAR